MGLDSPQFVDLTETDCAFLQQVSYAITSDTLRTAIIFDPKWSKGDNSGDEQSNDAIKFIESDIEAINKYSDRADELEEFLSSLKYLSVLKTLSPMLLGLGVGIRLARTYFDVKTEQKKQKLEAAVGIPSPAMTTTNDRGSASNEISPPVGAAAVAEAPLNQS